MKRYGIPLIVIAILATAAYAWRASVARHEQIRNQRKAHLDSLKQVQPKRSSAFVPLGTIEPGVTKMVARYDTVSFKDIWDAKRIPMPDSIDPRAFSERSCPAPQYNADGSYYDDDDHPYVVDSNGKFNMVASIREYYEQEFVHQTVMKMLLEHLTNPVNAEEFGRCPSGYFIAHGVDAVIGSDSEIRHGPSEDWKYGDVYFGEGCDDTLVCKYRIQYEKRWVEMKDPNARQYVSLRTYELMKFGTAMAAALRPKE